MIPGLGNLNNLTPKQLLALAVSYGVDPRMINLGGGVDAVAPGAAPGVAPTTAPAAAAAVLNGGAALPGNFINQLPDDALAPSGGGAGQEALARPGRFAGAVAKPTGGVGGFPGANAGNITAAAADAQDLSGRMPGAAAGTSGVPGDFYPSDDGTGRESLVDAGFMPDGGSGFAGQSNQLRPELTEAQYTKRPGSRRRDNPFKRRYSKRPSLRQYAHNTVRPYIKDFNRNDPNYHKYELGPYPVCRVKRDGKKIRVRCTRDFVAAQLARMHVPTEPIQKGPGEYKVGWRWPRFARGGPIRYERPTAHILINRTIGDRPGRKGHRFHPGVVVSSVFEYDDCVYVYTVGVGTGPEKEFNRVAGPWIFKNIIGDLQDGLRFLGRCK